MLFSESVNTFTWNPLHLAIYFNRLELVKYYFSLIEHGFNAKLSLLGPSQGPDKESGELMFPSQDEQTFSLVLAINNQEIGMLELLLEPWQKLIIWTTDNIGFALRGAISEEWLGGISTILNSTITKKIFYGLDYF